MKGHETGGRPWGTVALWLLLQSSETQVAPGIDSVRQESSTQLRSFSSDATRGAREEVCVESEAADGWGYEVCPHQAVPLSSIYLSFHPIIASIELAGAHLEPVSGLF